MARAKAPAPTPARKGAFQLETLPKRKRPRGHGAPRAVLVPILVLAVGGAGAAGWIVGSSDSGSPATVDPAVLKAQRAAEARADAAAAVEEKRIAWLGSANDAVETLRSRRASDRRLLAAADTPAEQAARGRRLARSYALTRRALSNPPASVPRAAAVQAALRRAQGAYERLARSVQNGNRSAYQRAVASVRSAERDLDRALARLGEPS